MMPTKSFSWHFLWAMAFSAVVYVVYVHFQPTYTYSLLDPRYDAHKYAQLYQFFKGSTPNFQASFPFNTRVLMPWLAAQLPFQDIKTSFIWLNGLFIVATIGVLTLLWQQLRIRPIVIFIGIFWLLFHWKGMVRMYLPDPATADVGGYFFQSIWLGLILRYTLLVSDDTDKGRRHNFNFYMFITAYFIAILGTLQKEVFLAVVGVTITYFFTFNFQKVTNQFTLIFMVSILTYLVATHYFPPSTSDWRHSAFVSVLRGLKRYFSQPELFLRLPVSWLLAFGTFWLVVIEEWKIKNRKQKTEKGKFGTRHAALGTQHFQLGTFLWLFLSVVGGGDTTRILFNGMPFVLTFLLLRLNQKPVWVSVYVLATSLPLMRLFSLEPDLGLHPQAMQAWCVECWYFWESWPYWAYATFVLTGYYYLARRLGVGSRKTNEVESRR